LQKDKFWNAQIEQINVLPTREIELIPLVGDQTIFMGTIYNYEKKLSRLKRFYTEAMNKVGWNKYSRINLEFDNQIICTKKGK
jgi:cell division protein FtsQ